MSQQLTLGNCRQCNASASNHYRILKELMNQDPSRAPKHWRFDVRHITNRRKHKEQEDVRTFLNFKKKGKDIQQEELYHNLLRQEELGREDSYSAPVIFKILLSARILFVPNRNKLKRFPRLSHSIDLMTQWNTSHHTKTIWPWVQHVKQCYVNFLRNIVQRFIRASDICTPWIKGRRKINTLGWIH